MCGIAGIVSFDEKPVVLEELRSMCASIVHRGPDDKGFYLGTGVGLGMRRLSVIDLETGHQPVRNEDGSIWVVFNGEIYNFRELRDELEARGHSFYTATDTETITHLYEEYGSRCVEKMRGIFAFALWDECRRRLLLGRDRLGVKPLYYAQVGQRLIFASELKAMLQLPDVERNLNWASLSRFFTFLATPRSESIIAGVHKLEPGHILVALPNRKVYVERYWDVAFEPDYSRTEAYFVSRLRELLAESVSLRLVSDVPLGAFLSGGIDSSAIVAMMSRLSSGPVRTFSIGFREDKYNELSYADLVAKKFGTEHHELTLEPDALSILGDLPWYLDEPFGDPSAIPTFLVSELAAKHVKVLLSGDGGDELFAGYDRYLVEDKEHSYRLPSPARRALGAIAYMMPEGMKGRNFLRHSSLVGVERYLNSMTFFGREAQKKLFQPGVFDQLSSYAPWREEIDHYAKTDGNWLSALQYLDLNSYLPLDILTKVDRMSMAHSIEARVPLLDHQLVEFAATIPPEFKLRNGTTKYILKCAMRGILPDEIIDRPKHGFSIPLEQWFRGQLGSLVHELLLSERNQQRGIFNTGYIKRLLDRHQKGRDLSWQLWTLISFELWCQTFLDS